MLGGGEAAVEAKLQPNDLLRKSLLFGEAEKAASPPQKRRAERTAAGLHRENCVSRKGQFTVYSAPQP
ncbi:MAG: hypothetical protein J1F60_09340 [Oscillospiraceae bacterium]|nr:hypothetical protein [Oscillospiraceae bacterium]